MNQFTASLWGDEAFSAILSMKPIPEIISIIARDTSPPLYNLTEHIWFQIFGTSEIAVRIGKSVAYVSNSSKKSFLPLLSNCGLFCL